ncbi:vWA domain-containing protein [Xenorhabdus griffiniae]|uniref:VWA domain-containing protein n=2 Tax=Xenorhabdus griffiniae TaxID=351672 RepID=A0ABY9XF49_9GAMM|nr:vWA domain-containing protein [Xenorhabdus griffiniae]MBD1226677.1 VWA domain-containing protein [Xenorhabdus griffiniae]MBE8586137.1 VWA domain-containing protein [Xenorhabdus griffiniae]WMV71548.1 vWA domain-containing protein [Xenorhabdus griffiniae]WNH01225.1 vWA domain-containing protein [Xenorhabdus griffiniae]
MMKYLGWLVAGFPALALVVSTGASAQTPLLQEGKQTLYQRVLTYPGCELSAKIGEKGKEQPAFSRFYVYQRQQQGNEEWLHVGPDSYGYPRGWMKSGCTVDWKMQLTLAFTNPSGRSPMLFFRDKTDVEDILNKPNPAAQLQPLLSGLKEGKSVSSVLAREPDYMINQHQNFYLLPVLDSDDIFTNTGYQVRILNVASVSETPNSEQDKGSNISPDKEKNMMKGFSASVVFVIDSTISMGPYIDRTKQAIEKIYQQIEKENLLGQVKFGLIAYRSNVTAVPGLEYDSKLYVDPNTVKDGKDFLAKVRDLKQAKVSSSKVNEDAYAGVMTALDKVDWTKFGARYVILVTDAGALEGDDKLSTTKLDATQVRLEATYRGVALYALHLKTPAGRKNHASAESQYRELTLNAFLHKPLYYPIDSGDVNSFGTIVDSLANAITGQIKTAWSGKETVGSALGADESYSSDAGEKEALLQGPLLRDAALLGHAMQLAYLGEKQGIQAPPVFKSWISDRDLVKQNIPATEVKVLLTKSELSDLSEIMKKIVDAANEGLISPDDMFASLRSLAATMGNDPKQAKNKQATKLGEMGLLGEYIEGLPYLSEVLSLDEETWKSWDGLEQERFIRRLNTKLKYYQRYNEDVDRWISLAPDSDPRDNVYPVPLENLP